MLLAMASIVAGVTEEAAFRGYIQGPIERRHGPMAAILTSGVLFGMVHYNHHPADVVTMLLYYVAVSFVCGGLAYATNSILPGLVLHTGGDILSFLQSFATGRPEWQMAAPADALPPLIWNSGVDTDGG